MSKDREKEIRESLEAWFLEIVSKHHIGKWAFEELEHEVFVNHSDYFQNLSQEEQWYTRGYLSALAKIYK